MLSKLHIENYALIRSLDISFDDGFTAITGETGAGKSIIMGALSLILGHRADTTILYNKAKKCYIEGEFEIEKLNLSHFFEEHNLDYHDTTILRREINEIGKSRAFINDTPVTLPILKELAVKLVDIHSQHQNLLLNNAEFRVDILDNVALSYPLLQSYKTAYKQYQDTEKQWKTVQEEQIKLEEERDYLHYLNEELQQANPIAGEEDEIEQKITLLANAELIKGKLYHASQLFSEGENDILQQLKEVKKDCEDVAHYNTHFEEYVKRIDNMLIELQDVAFGISKIEEETNVNPAQLEELRTRQDIIYTLEQKHHVSNLEALLEKWQSIAEKLDSMADNQALLEKLTIEKESALQKLKENAIALTKARQTAIPILEKAMLQKIALLGMEDARFSIKIDTKDRYSANGVDEIAFYFSANKGGTFEEIGKVASGGELSRLMLAIKSIITESSLLPTVIFDEIDTGISGDIAGKVANMMKELSKQHQLLTITHLPQIAAKSTLHYHVYKEVIDNKTYTNIKLLGQEERVGELAKMISGEVVTRGAQEAARELLG